jgi:ribose transport system permease protein
VIGGVPRWRLGQIAQAAVAPVCLALSLYAFFWISPGELSADNLQHLIGQMAPIAIVAIGQMVVIITRGFDLSVGSVAGLSVVMTAVGINWLGPVGMVLGPLTGLACGLGTVTFSGCRLRSS